MGGLCPSPRVLFGLVLSPQRRGGFGDSGGDTRWGLTCGHKRDITNPGDSICPQMVLSLLVVAQDGVPPLNLLCSQLPLCPGSALLSLLSILERVRWLVNTFLSAFRTSTSASSPGTPLQHPSATGLPHN